MTTLVAVPEWVVPPAQQVVDYYQISYAVVAETRRLLTGGHAAAVYWATGGQLPAPISKRRAEHRSANLVRAERDLARVVAWEMPPMSPAEWPISASSRREPVNDNLEWATGVEAALSWLLGDRAEPPARLPRRHSDGTVLTADELYAEMVEAAPYRYELPEQRRDGRNRAAADAALYRRLAALAASAR